MSLLVKYVEKIDGTWWFWDESQADRFGPFLTEVEAEAASYRYMRECLDGESTPTPIWVRPWLDVAP